LSKAILAAMGWVGGHLHTFNVAGRDYGDPRALDDVADEKRITLNGVIKAGVERFTYLYDFGDSWDHVISIEKTESAADGQSYPVCVEGKRNCPRRIAAARGDMPSSWRSSQTPPARNAPSDSSGWTTRTSTPRRSTWNERTVASPPKPSDADQSESRRARGPSPRKRFGRGESRL
jgi:Plasmid pRiA4b ORF-3-like protein